MKWKAYALAAVVSAVFVSCGSNSSDKETTTTEDTVTANTTTVTDPMTSSPTVNVPANTKTVFETKYPQASNVSWSAYSPDYSTVEWDWTGWPKLDTADYSARFNWQGSEHWAWYDEQGNWVGTITPVSDHTTLPAPVTSLINSQYKDQVVTSINRENDKNRTAYEITLDKNGAKTKLLVDENGKVLKKKTVTDDMKTKEKMNPKDSM